MPHGQNGAQNAGQVQQNAVQAQQINITERTANDYLRFTPQRETLYQAYGQQFVNHNITDIERNSKKNNHRSRLYKKRVNVANLNNKVNERKNRQMLIVQEFMADQLVNCPDDLYRDLSAFMGETGSDNKEIIDNYFGRQNQENPQQRENADVKKALKLMLRQLLSINISSLHLDNDKEIAGNAGVLEKLADQVGAFDRLLSRHPDFTDGWTDEMKNLFNQRMTALRSISLYYQARKDIMSDPYYKEHYDDEISMEIRDGQTEAQQELAKKLMVAYVLGKAMVRANSAQLQQGQGAGVNAAQEEGPQLTEQESIQRFAQLNAIYQSPEGLLVRSLSLRTQQNDADFRQKARTKHKTTFDNAAKRNEAMRNNYLVNKHALATPSWVSKHSNDINLNSRVRRICSCMAFLRNDNENASWEMYDELTLNTENAKTSVKIKKARGFEKLFRYIREFDLTKFEYVSNEAAKKTRYLKAHAMGTMMKAMPESFFTEYEALMEDTTAECAMNPDEVKEVRARWAAIRSAASGNLHAQTRFDTLLQPERRKLGLDRLDALKARENERFEHRKQELVNQYLAAQAQQNNDQAHQQEMDNIQQNMANVQGRGFAIVHRPDHRITFLGKAKNFLMMGLRGVTRVLSTVLGGALVSQTYEATVPIYKWRHKDVLDNAQERRRHDMVPGKKGEYFEEEKVAKNEQGEDLEVYSDVRRGPLVWEKLTAGDPDDPPEVTIMTQQGKRGNVNALGDVGFRDVFSSRQPDGIMGHAVIALSYSRYSKVTRRKERYQLRMGFYPGGGTGLKANAPQLAGSYVPGQLVDDGAHAYDVARRFTVKPGDINKILKKAETYADGGYNLFKRNCATFVVEMAKEINLPIADMFKEEQAQLGLGLTAIKEIGAGAANSTFFGGAGDVIDGMNKDDITYQNFGQKMFTKEDFNRYQRTFNTGDWFKSGYNPGLLGEDLRKAKSGILSAGYEENLKEQDMDRLLARQADLAAQIWGDITRIIPLDQRTQQDIDFEQTLKLTKDRGYLYEKNRGDGANADTYRVIHRALRKAIKDVNDYYTGRLDCDDRINAEVMEYLSILETIMSRVDESYQEALKRKTQGNTGDIMYDFIYTDEMIIYIQADAIEPITVNIPPAIYEGLLTSGNTPEQAIRTCARFNELRNREDPPLTDEEKEEKENLAKKIRLAADFGNASRYLLEKDEFTDKELCYAFKDLPIKERQVTQPTDFLSGGMVNGNKYPSVYYQIIMLDRMVFGDFGQLHLEEIQGDHQPKAQALDTFMVNRLNANEENFRTILKYYLDGKNNEQPEQLEYALMKDFYFRCLEGSYKNRLSGQDRNGIINYMSTQSETRNRIIQLINEVRAQQQPQQPQQPQPQPQ